MSTTILQDILNPKNFGKFVLEVTSWENDADHYQTNHFFLDTQEELGNTIVMLNLLGGFPVLKSRSSDEVYELFGVKFSSLEELYELEDKYFYEQDDTGQYDKGLFGNGLYMDSYMEFVGGYQYETSILRQLESFKTFKLSDDGVLTEI